MAANYGGGNNPFPTDYAQYRDVTDLKKEPEEFPERSSSRVSIGGVTSTYNSPAGSRAPSQSPTPWGPLKSALKNSRSFSFRDSPCSSRGRRSRSNSNRPPSPKPQRPTFFNRKSTAAASTSAPASTPAPVKFSPMNRESGSDSSDDAEPVIVPAKPAATATAPAVEKKPLYKFPSLSSSESDEETPAKVKTPPKKKVTPVRAPAVLDSSSDSEPEPAPAPVPAPEPGPSTAEPPAPVVEVQKQIDIISIDDDDGEIIFDGTTKSTAERLIDLTKEKRTRDLEDEITIEETTYSSVSAAYSPPASGSSESDAQLRSGSPSRRRRSRRDRWEKSRMSTETREESMSIEVLDVDDQSASPDIAPEPVPIVPEPEPITPEPEPMIPEAEPIVPEPTTSHAIDDAPSAVTSSEASETTVDIQRDSASPELIEVEPSQPSTSESSKPKSARSRKKIRTEAERLGDELLERNRNSGRKFKMDEYKMRNATRKTPSKIRETSAGDSGSLDKEVGDLTLHEAPEPMVEQDPVVRQKEPEPLRAHNRTEEAPEPTGNKKRNRKKKTEAERLAEELLERNRNSGSKFKMDDYEMQNAIQMMKKSAENDPVQGSSESPNEDEGSPRKALASSPVSRRRREVSTEKHDVKNVERNVNMKTKKMESVISEPAIAEKFIGSKSKRKKKTEAERLADELIERNRNSGIKFKMDIDEMLLTTKKDQSEDVQPSVASYSSSGSNDTEALLECELLESESAKTPRSRRTKKARTEARRLAKIKSKLEKAVEEAPASEPYLVQIDDDDDAHSVELVEPPFESEISKDKPSLSIAETVEASPEAPVSYPPPEFPETHHDAFMNDEPACGDRRLHTRATNHRQSGRTRKNVSVLEEPPVAISEPDPTLYAESDSESGVGTSPKEAPVEIKDAKKRRGRAKSKDQRSISERSKKIEPSSKNKSEESIKPPALKASPLRNRRNEADRLREEEEKRQRELEEAREAKEQAERQEEVDECEVTVTEAAQLDTEEHNEALEPERESDPGPAPRTSDGLGEDEQLQIASNEFDQGPQEIPSPELSLYEDKDLPAQAVEPAESSFSECSGDVKASGKTTGITVESGSDDLERECDNIMSDLFPEEAARAPEPAPDLVTPGAPLSSDAAATESASVAAPEATLDDVTVIDLGSSDDALDDVSIIDDGSADADVSSEVGDENADADGAEDALRTVSELFPAKNKDVDYVPPRPGGRQYRVEDDDDDDDVIDEEQWSRRSAKMKAGGLRNEEATPSKRRRRNGSREVAPEVINIEEDMQLSTRRRNRRAGHRMVTRGDGDDRLYEALPLTRTYNRKVPFERKPASVRVDSAQQSTSPSLNSKSLSPFQYMPSLDEDPWAEQEERELTGVYAAALRQRKILAKNVAKELHPGDELYRRREEIALMRKFRRQLRWNMHRDRVEAEEEARRQLRLKHHENLKKEYTAAKEANQLLRINTFLKNGGPAKDQHHNQFLFPPNHYTDPEVGDRKLSELTTTDGHCHVHYETECEAQSESAMQICSDPGSVRHGRKAREQTHVKIWLNPSEEHFLPDCIMEGVKGFNEAISVNAGNRRRISAPQMSSEDVKRFAEGRMQLINRDPSRNIIAEDIEVLIAGEKMEQVLKEHYSTNFVPPRMSENERRREPLPRY